MHTLVIIRHGESQWNKLNLFCGWTDVDLTETGYEEAHQAGRLLREGNYHFDICYTSVLKRAIHTAYTVLDELDLAWIPMVKDYHLNERHYGALQGLNKKETAEKYIKRLEELEELVNSFEAVEKSYAISAGREVRIFVNPDKTDDLAAMKLAKDIAKRVEGELKYPGEIKILVFRETRAIEFAR